MLDALYRDHVATLSARAESALAACGFDGMVVSSGKPFTYYADDQDAPFRRVPHFAHWVPMAGPSHLLIVKRGEKPRLVRHAPEDYWYEQAPLGSPFWASAFEIVECGSTARVWASFPKDGTFAYVGDEPDAARAAGVSADALNPKSLIARLDWDRSSKTPYEVACLEEATARAADGHRAARTAFRRGASELEIHHAYVAACASTDAELPYGSIVALDDKGAILHYEGKRTQRNGKVLLIDAGAMCRGYGSDITRTWCTAEAHPVFRGMVEALDGLQRRLCDAVKPGIPYLDLHLAAHAGIADLLKDHGVLKRGGVDAVAAGLTRPFYPHGLGHFLGIQVHDVSGRQATPEGGLKPPPAEHPYLRTTRTVEAGQVFTIEPGIYFIPMLLRELRASPHAGDVDWALVEALTPMGGIRIEDNLLVVPSGHRNLTREHLPE